jgi:hypothetical protein
VGLYATASGGTNNYAGIFDAGNVGINTTTPGAKLHVNSPTATIIASIFKTTDDNATKNLTEWQTSGGSAVASMNCVGDITANSFSNAPNPDTATNGFYFEGTVTKRFNVLVNAAVSNVEAQLLLQRRRAGSFSVTAGDFMGSVTWNTMSFLNGFATANVTGGFSTIDMAFTAVNAAGTSAERVRWTAEGLYGINTSAPSAMLHAKSNVTTTKTAILQNIASQTASALEAQNSSGTPYVTIGPGTLAGDTTNNWLNVTGTFPATRTASTRGVNFEITGAGSSNFELDAFRVNFNAGYTGANFCIALNMVNSNAGTGTGVIGGGAGNYGGYLQAIPSTTGYNVGFHGEAGLGVVNLGVQGIALRAKNSGTNIGIVGLANNSGTSPVVVGGWFALSASPSAPSTSAALIADTTGTSTADIIRAQNATVPVFKVIPNGTGAGKSQILAGASSTFGSMGAGIFDHFVDAGNSTTTETDLYSDSIPASALNTNGDKLRAIYAGTLVSSATATREIKIYFGGTVIFDTGAVTLGVSGDFVINVEIIRDSSTSVRCAVWANLTGPSTGSYANYATVTGLTLTNAQTLKITGQAAGVGAATNDLVASLGHVEWKSAA